MEIPSLLPKDSSLPNTSIRTGEGKGKKGGEVVGQNLEPRVNSTELGSVHALSPKELLNRQLLLAKLPLPKGRIYSILLQFISEGPSSKYILRIGLVKQFLDKGLSVSIERLKTIYTLLEGTVSVEEAQDRDNRGGTLFSPALVNDPSIPLSRHRVSDLVEEFNQAKNREGRWMVIPFSYSMEGVPYHACVRLFVKGTPHPSKIIFSVRRSEDGAGSWYFLWYPENSERPLSIIVPRGKDTREPIPSNLLEGFQQKLRKLGLFLDDKKNRVITYDGFDEFAGKVENIDQWI